MHNLSKSPDTKIRGYLQDVRLSHASSMLEGCKLDPTLISVECTITLDDVALQLNLSVDGLVVTGSALVLGKEDIYEAFLGKVPNKFQGGQINMKMSSAEIFGHSKYVGCESAIDSVCEGGDAQTRLSDVVIWVKAKNLTVTVRHGSTLQTGSLGKERQKLARLPQGVHRHLGLVAGKPYMLSIKVKNRLIRRGHDDRPNSVGSEKVPRLMLMHILAPIATPMPTPMSSSMSISIPRSMSTYSGFATSYDYLSIVS
ncbi:hypothetical protein Golax_019961 [Gossypium laxum]|uniref:Uncharacterized protein n=1 Tax=Gossypium laxum TaxID=34288 RepID=A0A7J8Z8S3_9ROSI|nr:hypothetical protein [Gossypium laxum]